MKREGHTTTAEAPFDLKMGLGTAPAGAGMAAGDSLQYYSEPGMSQQSPCLRARPSRALQW